MEALVGTSFVLSLYLARAACLTSVLFCGLILPNLVGQLTLAQSTPVTPPYPTKSSSLAYSGLVCPHGWALPSPVGGHALAQCSAAALPRLVGAHSLHRGCP